MTATPQDSNTAGQQHKQQRAAAVHTAAARTEATTVQPTVVDRRSAARAERDGPVPGPPVDPHAGDNDPVARWSLGVRTAESFMLDAVVRQHRWWSPLSRSTATHDRRD